MSLGCCWQINGRDLPRPVICKDWLWPMTTQPRPSMEDLLCRAGWWCSDMVCSCPLGALALGFPGQYRPRSTPIWISWWIFWHSLYFLQFCSFNKGDLLNIKFYLSNYICKIFHIYLNPGNSPLSYVFLIELENNIRKACAHSANVEWTIWGSLRMAEWVMKGLRDFLRGKLMLLGETVSPGPRR